MRTKKPHDYSRAQRDELSLEDMLPDAMFNDPRCYDSRKYGEWEREVATPALEALGYDVDYWWNQDGDSFGPLVRAVGLFKDGKTFVATYG